MDVKAAIQEQVAIAEAALRKARNLADVFGESFEYGRPHHDRDVRGYYDPQEVGASRALEILASDIEMPVEVRQRLVAILELEPF